MKLLERLGTAPAASPAAPLRASGPPTGFDDGPVFDKPPVGPSADLSRVIALPRRDLATAYSAAEVAALERALRRPDPKCVCAAQGRACPTSFRSVQGVALLEAQRTGTLFAPMGAGHGKTLVDLLLPMVLPECRIAVLFIPANLKEQLVQRDIPYYGGHWKLPNVAGGQWFVPGRPVLHIITYSQLSQPKSTDLLQRIKPDTLIADEAHNLKDHRGPRMGRIHRLEELLPGRRFIPLSGTFATRSIKDCTHLSALALGENSPYPLQYRATEEWSLALDPDLKVMAPPGALGRLCSSPGEPVRVAFRRRRNDTPGVVATSEAAVQTTLIIRKRDPGTVPEGILKDIESAHGGVRPDGEEFVEQLAAASCARQLSAGFFHRWRYPHGEPEELIKTWFTRRQEWNRELRKKLSSPQEHLDSPGLLQQAAIRWHEGYFYSTHVHTDDCFPPATEETIQVHEHTIDCDLDCDIETDPPKPICKPKPWERTWVPPHTRRGPLAAWESETWPAWKEIRFKVRPVSQAVWVSDFLARDAAAWAKKTTGIVWVEFPELGQKIAELAGLRYFGRGKQAGIDIAEEKGQRSIVASIKAHGTGKNLQYAFSRNLVVTPPADGAIWEQMIARTHRPGQKADEVEVELYQHTDDYEGAFKKAREFARFMEEEGGQQQRLLMANYEWA